MEEKEQMDFRDQFRKMSDDVGKMARQLQRFAPDDLSGDRFPLLCGEPVPAGRTVRGTVPAGIGSDRTDRCAEIGTGRAG